MSASRRPHAGAAPDTARDEAGPDLPFVSAAHATPHRIALVVDGEEHTYGDLLAASERVARFLLRGRRDLEESRIVLLVPPGFEYVAAQWGIWRAGGVVVPLALAHPVRELVSLIEDVEPELVLLHPDTEEKGIPATMACGVPHEQARRALLGPRSRDDISAPAPSRDDIPAPASPAAPPHAPLPRISPARRAHIIYTSGTTGRPKGVVTTHDNTRFQVESIREAWEIGEGDRVLNALPLHHVHGIINALLCPLSCGAMVEILPRFDADRVWRRLDDLRANVFMGVPTMYVRLIRAWEGAPPDRRRRLRRRARSARVMISGSAALPARVHRRWREVTGHAILERYGLTETGMVLSNPLRGPRVEGHVGHPLPWMDVRLRADEGEPDNEGEPDGERGAEREGKAEVSGPRRHEPRAAPLGVHETGALQARAEPRPEGEPRATPLSAREAGAIEARAEPRKAGTIEVRGRGVFREYWRRPEETAAAFRDGWFDTGDRAVLGEGGYRILGRESVDIIKTGGEKVSALEVEEALREHPRVADCAVVGLPHEEWGERVSAAVVFAAPRATTEPPQRPAQATAPPTAAAPTEDAAPAEPTAPAHAPAPSTAHAPAEPTAPAQATAPAPAEPTTPAQATATAPTEDAVPAEPPAPTQAPAPSTPPAPPPAPPVSEAELRAWIKERLAGYKVPARIMGVEALPRNSMGKVLKPQVRDLLLRPARRPSP